MSFHPKVCHNILIVRQCLPIIVTAHLPGVIEVIVIKVELLVSDLLVNTFKVIGPRYLRLLATIEVHPLLLSARDTYILGLRPTMNPILST